jgi:RHH-type transcriptional regulator, rel operon repressor / antitoxin RelB
MYTFHYTRTQMTTTLSVRIDRDTRDRLEALAKRARRSKSFLAAEAIAAYVEAERWQLDEIEAGLRELDKGRAATHEDVSKWLRSWGKTRERKAPRA